VDTSISQAKKKEEEEEASLPSKDVQIIESFFVTQTILLLLQQHKKLRKSTSSQRQTHSSSGTGVSPQNSNIVTVVVATRKTEREDHLTHVPFSICQNPPTGQLQLDSDAS